MNGPTACDWLGSPEAKLSLPTFIDHLIPDLFIVSTAERSLVDRIVQAEAHERELNIRQAQHA